MNRKRISDTNEDVSDAKKSKKSNNKEVTVKDEVDKFYENPLSVEYQPQFFNYQLIGDFLAIMILNGKNIVNKIRTTKPILFQNFCHSAWSVNDLLSELKSKKYLYPIAKTVILSVGYNDYHDNSLSALMLVDNIEKITQKLHRRGCKDIILTNIPPCGADKDSVDHWKYLQIANEEIFRLTEKYDFICHCDIFKLFCSPKNYFTNTSNYVTFEEINYKMEYPMYNEKKNCNRTDLISFSDLGKSVLAQYVEKIVRGRLNQLRQKSVKTVVSLLDESVDTKIKLLDVIELDSPTSKPEKIDNPPKTPIIIDLEDDEKDDFSTHLFGCVCENCERENRELMQDMLNTIKSVNDVKDEKPA